VRNIFDQYKEPENRLTHALATCLHRDPALLRRFLKWTTGADPKGRGRLQILEQRIPGQPQETETDCDEGKGLPDMWIHDDPEDWCVLVECKVAAPLDSGQLRRHRATARRQGFSQILLLAIAPSLPARKMEGVSYFAWPDVYAWMRRQRSRSAWAEEMADYMPVAESRMIADGYLMKGTITMFDGIQFDNDHRYTYGEAKRILRLMMDELRERSDLIRFGIDPKAAGRPAITGREVGGVWDFLPLKAARSANSFTSYPHLTLSIDQHVVRVIMILPNGASPRFRRNLVGLGVEGLRELVSEVGKLILRDARHVPGSKPLMTVVQRHYTSRRSAPINDAEVNFDIRTVMEESSGPVKAQPEWISAAHAVLANRKSNIQVSIGATFPHGSDVMASRKSLDVVAGVWLACKPWLETLLGGED